MIIYNYDSITFEYTGESYASLDPEESKKQGKEVYLIPAYATDKKPPTPKTNETVIFANGWKIVPDYRGMYMVDKSMQPKKVEDFGNLPDGFVPITEEQAEIIEQDDLYYVIKDGKLIQNPDYEKQKEEREKEHISHLTCTKRVFVLMLEQMGLDYFEQIAPLINANRQASLEWTLCVELERANPLLDLIGKQLGISSAQIDKLFQYANNEISQEEFLND